ncbi:MAG: MOSC domain-containing protein [Candidatus Obscuribacterales bacterium]|nr:MOSC domain-containing protein [Candidatus Obscuribacterales bacterium]
MIQISELNTYPLKSARGISLQEAFVDHCGIKHDRSFLLVDKNGLAITQRDYARLALVSPQILDEERVLFRAPEMPELIVTRTFSAPNFSAKVWNDQIDVSEQSEEASVWFSRFLDFESRLVCMAKNARRPVDPDYATGEQELAFADGFPFLLITQKSLDDLNSRLEVPVPMNRFRPNIVLSGAEPFAEDKWKKIRISGIEFDLVKPCARCVMITIDQDFALLAKEPMRTLSTYRKVGNKVLFGQNLVHHSSGKLSIGQTVEILDSI